MKIYGAEVAEGSEITNLTVKTGTGDPSNPNAGELFFRTDTGKLRIYNGTSWLDINTGIAGGVSTFIDLTDTPSSFTSSGGYLLRVNSGATAVEFVDGTSLFAGSSHDHTGTYQPLDTQLTDIAGLTPTKGNVVIGDGTNFIALSVGTNNYVLTADDSTASGVKWAVSSGGLQNIVEDSTPQLGGNLDVKGYSIAGAPAPDTTSAGGNLILVGGSGGVTSGQGGSTLIFGGSPQGTNQTGGAAYIYGGSPTGTGSGGPALLQGGGLNTTGASGGDASLVGGYTGSGNAGDAVIDGGRGYQAGGVPGDVRIRPGVNSTDVTQGAIFFEAISGSVPPDVRWKNGSYYVALKAPSLTANRTWILPNDDPSTASGKFLTTNSSGNLSFSTVTATGDTSPTPNTLAQRDASGDLYAVNFVSSSDETLKKDIRPIENALDIVNNLEGKRFKFINNEREQVGFIAQQIEKVLPEVVETGADGRKFVGYANITAVLAEAIKEQNKKIEELQQLVKSLMENAMGDK